MQKGKRKAGVLDDSSKMCSRCSATLSLDNFAKDKRGAFRVTSICKECRISDRENSNSKERVKKREDARIEHINSLLAKESSKKSTTCVEDIAVRTLQEQSLEAGVVVEKWHDGTRSDVGIRPVEIDTDLWCPVQVKSTAAVVPKFQWNVGRLPYKMPTLLMTGCSEQTFILWPSDFEDHAKKLATGMVFYGVAGGYWRKVMQPLGIVQAMRQIGLFWRSEHGKQLHGMLESEEALQMQCSVDSQREYVAASLLCKLKSVQLSLPTFQSTWDRVEAGLRVQDKSASWMREENTPYFKAKCARLMSGHEVPYVVGDADVYIFAVVVERLRLLLEWRIPENAMDKMLNRLSRVANGKVVSIGRSCLNLPVIGPSGENCHLHEQIFGFRWPRKDTDLRPALFLNVHQIPENIVLPECVCDRDPIAV